jgi:flagellar basal body-associated protein FliL
LTGDLVAAADRGSIANVDQKIKIGEATRMIKKIGITSLAVVLLLSAFSVIASANEGKSEKKGGDNAMFQVDPFIVNIGDNNGTKFLKITICLELSSPSLAERAKAKAAAIRDAVIMLVTSKSADAFNSPEGKPQLKDELIMTLNKVLGEKTVKNIYFTEFIMQ